MTTELAYVAEKFQEIEVLENFVPILNKKGKAKLCFIQAQADLIEKDDDELGLLRFQFLCEGVNGSQVINYTGWLKDALSENSSLGRILKGFGIVEFSQPKSVVVEEFDFESNFQEKVKPKSVLNFNELMTKLTEIEGTLLLAELTVDKGIWHRPDPDTFEYPRDKQGKFYKSDVSSYKK
jgi:hypothetical protein